MSLTEPRKRKRMADEPPRTQQNVSEIKKTQLDATDVEENDVNVSTIPRRVTDAFFSSGKTPSGKKGMFRAVSIWLTIAKMML